MYPCYLFITSILFSPIKMNSPSVIPDHEVKPVEDYRTFNEKLEHILNDIGSDVLHYNEGEFWMYRPDYEFIEYYAARYRMLNTAIALPLARGLHDNVYRKASVSRDDVSYLLPYIIHPLEVCRLLIELNVDLPKEECDILFAAALCHDLIEDVEFEHGGTELTRLYHLDPRVYETVMLVTKRKDFTEAEEQAHFDSITRNRLAMLVKAADRGNNVEDLYNRSSWKVHEYVGETRKYFFPMLEYAAENYKEISASISILKDKIYTLTVAAEFLVNRYDQQEKHFRKRIARLREENESLRKVWNERWHRNVQGKCGDLKAQTDQ